jgi:hypothetical protein
MQTNAAGVRIQRFAVTASYANFTRAAAALGCRKERLGAQIGPWPKAEGALPQSVSDVDIAELHHLVENPALNLTTVAEQLGVTSMRFAALWRRNLRHAFSMSFRCTGGAAFARLKG